MPTQHAAGRLGELLDLLRRPPPLHVGWLEDLDLAEIEPSLAVAAAGRLGKGIEPGHGPVDERKIKVHAGLDERRGDKSDRGARVEASPHRRQNMRAVPRAHQGRQVAGALRLRDEPVELARVPACVDDAQHPLRRPQARRQNRVVQDLRRPDADALQAPVEAARLGGDLAHRLEAIDEFRCLQSRLRRRAKHDRRAVVAGQLVQRCNARAQELQGKRLGLVEHHHAAGYVVQLAAARRPVGEEAFEELDRRGDDDGRIPVLHGEAELVSPLAFGDALLVEGAMVFEDEFAVLVPQGRPELGRGLLDDAGKGDDVDDALEPVLERMLQGEGERGEGLAAPRGHRQREDPRLARGTLARMAQDAAAQGIHRGPLRPGGKPIQMIVQSRLQSIEGRMAAARRHGTRESRVIGLGIEIVGVDKRGEQHADEERSTETGRVRVSRPKRQRR